MSSTVSDASPQTGGKSDKTSIALVVAFVLLVVGLAPFEIYTVMDLPAHILFVHAPIVLLPLAAVGLVGIAWHEGLRERFGVLVAAVTLAGMAGAILSVGAGEQFREKLFGGSGVGKGGTLDLHAQMGDRLRYAAVVLALLAVVLVVAHRLRRHDQSGGRLHGIADSRVFMISVAVLTTAMATFTFALTAYTGHLGSEAVWKDRVSAHRSAQGGPGSMSPPAQPQGQTDNR